MIKRYLVLLSLLLLPLAIAPATVSAVDIIDDQRVCSKTDKTQNSTLCKDEKIGSSNPLFGTDGILTKVANILSVVVGIIAVITIILAGIKFTTSGSNPQDLASARERIIYALIALIVAALAQVLVRYILSAI